MDEEGEQGYANPPIRSFFPQIRRSANILVKIRNHYHGWK